MKPVKRSQRKAPAQPPTVNGGDREARLGRYSEVVDRADLNFVQLIDLTFKLDPEYFTSTGEEEKTEKNFDMDVQIDGTMFDPEDGSAGIFVNCQAGAASGDQDLVRCRARYLVSYSNLSGCDREAVEAFLARVGRFSCYPYFRSLFASLDWAAFTGLPILPILKEAPKKPS